MTAVLVPGSPPRGKPRTAGLPVWELAYQFPLQGDWSEQEYLRLNLGRIVEFEDGFLEVHPMPTKLHQRLVKFLLSLFEAYLGTHKLGEVFPAPLPVHLWSGKYREPDLVFQLFSRDTAGDDYAEGADLVLEVVSSRGDDRHRDLVEKPQEYARAGIQEYWIVDPVKEEITVLTLTGSSYATHGVFKAGQQATSVLLNGFSVDVTGTLAAGMGPALES